MRSISGMPSSELAGDAKRRVPIQNRRRKEMKYKLKKVSWEITRKCNMNCIHCCCGDSKFDNNDELTYEEALDVAHQLVKMGVEQVTLTGGEPLLREGWQFLAHILWKGCVHVDMITNGQCIDKRVIRDLQYVGMEAVGVSVDGTQETHDRIRGPWSYDNCMSGVQQLVSARIPVTAVTTVHKLNIGELAQIAKDLRERGVRAWLVQLGMPFGNMEKNSDLVLEPQDIEQVIDFCYRESRNHDLMIHMGDSLGYYTKKETVVHSRTLGVNAPAVWKGCPAGMDSLNIACDGTIFGISLCVDQLKAGNLRERSLRDIWNDDDAFDFRRKLDPKKFKGFCGTCRYVETCLGGCLGMRLSTTGDIYGENPYCAYRNAVLRGERV